MTSVPSMSARGSTAVGVGLAGSTVTLPCAAYGGGAAARAVWASGGGPISGATRAITATIRISHPRNLVWTSLFVFIVFSFPLKEMKRWSDERNEKMGW